MLRILQLNPCHPAINAQALPYELVTAFTPEERDAVIHTRGADFDVVISAFNQPFQEAWFEHLPNVRLIASYGVGFDVYPLEALQAHHIRLTNTPDVLSDAVADMALALLLAVARGIVRADQFVRQGCWEQGQVFPLTTDVVGKKVGIVGLGSIGKVIAKRLTGFDCEIRYHNRRPRTDVPWTYVDHVVELAQWADILIAVMPGTPATRHMINRDVLQALGAQGIFINVARGSVVDEQALVALLQSGELGAAGLDVFAQEPHVPDVLKTLPNVVLAPHVASGTQECRHTMAQLLMDNIHAFARGEDLLTPVI